MDYIEQGGVLALVNYNNWQVFVGGGGVPEIIVTVRKTTRRFEHLAINHLHACFLFVQIGKNIGV